MVFSLIERYGVSLFEKNVRNPLQRSSINAEIESTLKNNPSYFWYYNNGITAITRSIPDISQQAEEFEVIGLQIINGAQTAYSIFKALQTCSPEQRALIDAEARITFRLLKSGGKDFDLKVTKYTNSQNPVSDRDFWSNDPVQEKVQEYFYDTNHWYERRAGEFRKPPEQVSIIPNTFVASAHLAFWLGDPVGVFDAAMKRESKKIDLVFTSFKENEKGLYEKIFNKDTDSKAVFASFCMFDLLTDGDGFEIPTIFFTNGFHILAIAKVLLKKYLKAKFGDEVNLAEFIVKRHLTDNDKPLRQVITHASVIMNQEMKTDGPREERRQAFLNLMTKRAHFDVLLEKIESSPLDPETIDSIELKEAKEELDRLEDDEFETLEATE